MKPTHHESFFRTARALLARASLLAWVGLLPGCAIAPGGGGAVLQDELLMPVDIDPTNQQTNTNGAVVPHVTICANVADCKPDAGNRVRRDLLEPFWNLRAARETKKKEIWYGGQPATIAYSVKVDGGASLPIELSLDEQWRVVGVQVGDSRLKLDEQGTCVVENPHANRLMGCCDPDTQCPGSGLPASMYGELSGHLVVCDGSACTTSNRKKVARVRLRKIAGRP